MSENLMKCIIKVGAPYGMFHISKNCKGKIRSSNLVKGIITMFCEKTGGVTRLN